MNRDKKNRQHGGREMPKTIEGIYERGKITLAEKPAVRQSPVEVTFPDATEEPKLFTKVPSVFLHPLRVSRFRKITREELHER
jgi:hypothetical protein